MKGLQTAHLDAVPWSASTLEDSTGDRNHDLSHSYASSSLLVGEGLPMIGKLLGHNHVHTTARYAHLARDSVKAAAERVSDSLAVDLDNPPNPSAVT